jgi:hypothetical protein
LTQRHLHSPSIASVTGPDSTVFATFALAFGADNVAGQRKLRGFALVQVFQGDMDAMNEIFGFAWLVSPTAPASTEETSAATKELAEQILRLCFSTAHKINIGHAYLGIHPTHSALFRQGCFATGVIYMSLIRI